jgi:ABC-2 type transport system ATP-binding protein
LSQRELRSQIGFMPQDARFFPRFTARDFVIYCAWLRGIPTKERAAAADEALRAAGVVQIADQRLTKLSGGMRQRANLASALVNGPQLLLLDEPTNSLDIETRADFRTLIGAQTRDRVTLVSSHDIDQVEAVADQVLVLRGGRVLYSGTTANLLKERDAVRLEAAYLDLLRERR